MPDDLIPPELADIEHTFWSAFSELSTERQISVSAGPIPRSAIMRYARESGFIEEDVFFRVIRRMDNAYLSHEQGEGKTFSREMMKG